MGRLQTVVAVVVILVYKECVQAELPVNSSTENKLSWNGANRQLPAAAAPLSSTDYLQNADDTSPYDYELHSGLAETGTEAQPSRLEQILPLVSFECDREGYFADVKFHCEAFHYCSADGTRFTFLCGEGSKFNQRTMICDFNHALQCNNVNVEPATPETFDDELNSFSFNKQDITTEHQHDLSTNNVYLAPVSAVSNQKREWNQFQLELKNTDKLAGNFAVNTLNRTPYDRILTDINQLVNEMKVNNSNWPVDSNDAHASPVWSRMEHADAGGATDYSLTSSNSYRTKSDAQSHINTDSLLTARRGRHIALEDQGLLVLRDIVQSSKRVDPEIKRDYNGNLHIYGSRKSSSSSPSLRPPVPHPKTSNDVFDYNGGRFFNGDISHQNSFSLISQPFNFNFNNNFPQSVILDDSDNMEKPDNQKIAFRSGLSSPAETSRFRINWGEINNDEPLRQSHSVRKPVSTQLAEASNNRFDLFRHDNNRRITPEHRLSLDQLRQFQHELSIQKPPLAPHQPLPPYNFPPHQSGVSPSPFPNEPPLQESEGFFEPGPGVRSSSFNRPPGFVNVHNDNGDIFQSSIPEVRNYHLNSGLSNQRDAPPLGSSFITPSQHGHRFPPTLHPFIQPTIPPLLHSTPQPLSFNDGSTSHTNSEFSNIPRPSEQIVSDDYFIGGDSEDAFRPLNSPDFQRVSILPQPYNNRIKPEGLIATKNHFGYDTFVAPQFANNFHEVSPVQHESRPLLSQNIRKIPVPTLQPPIRFETSLSTDFSTGNSRPFDHTRLPHNFDHTGNKSLRQGQQNSPQSGLVSHPSFDSIADSHRDVNSVSKPHNPFQNVNIETNTEPSNLQRMNEMNENSYSEHKPKHRRPAVLQTSLPDDIGTPVFHQNTIFPAEKQKHVSSDFDDSSFEVQYHPNQEISRSEFSKLEIKKFSESNSPTSAHPPKITTPLPQIFQQNSTPESSMSINQMKEEMNTQSENVEDTTRGASFERSKQRRNRFRMRNRVTTNATRSSVSTTEIPSFSRTQSVELKSSRPRRPFRRRRPTNNGVSSSEAAETTQSTETSSNDKGERNNSGLLLQEVRTRSSIRSRLIGQKRRDGILRESESTNSRPFTRSFNQSMTKLSTDDSEPTEANNEQTKPEKLSGIEQFELNKVTRNVSLPVLDKNFRRFGRKRFRLRLRNFINNSTSFGTPSDDNSKREEKLKAITSLGNSDSSTTSQTSIPNHWRKFRGKHRKYRNGSTSARHSTRHSLSALDQEESDSQSEMEPTGISGLVHIEDNSDHNPDEGETPSIDEFDSEQKLHVIPLAPDSNDGGNNSSFASFVDKDESNDQDTAATSLIHHVFAYDRNSDSHANFQHDQNDYFSIQTKTTSQPIAPVIQKDLLNINESMPKLATTDHSSGFSEPRQTSYSHPNVTGPVSNQDDYVDSEKNDSTKKDKNDKNDREKVIDEMPISDQVIDSKELSAGNFLFEDHVQSASNEHKVDDETLPDIQIVLLDSVIDRGEAVAVDDESSNDRSVGNVLTDDTESRDQDGMASGVSHDHNLRAEHGESAASGNTLPAVTMATDPPMLPLQSLFAAMSDEQSTKN